MKNAKKSLIKTYNNIAVKYCSVFKEIHVYMRAWVDFSDDIKYIASFLIESENSTNTHH